MASGITLALPDRLQAANHLLAYRLFGFFMNAQTSGAMAKSRDYQQVGPSGAPNPSTFAWIVALVAIVAQQHDVVVELLDPNARAAIIGYAGHSAIGQPVPEPLAYPIINTVTSVASLVSIVIASSFVYRDIAKLLARNGAIIAYISFLVISAAWSIHPDLTLRRGLGCILTILVAGYLAIRFGEKDRMKLFSFVFAIIAIPSLFIIMTGSESAGGILAKQTLGKIMAVAIFVELYLLALGNWRPIWRFGLLSIFLTLLVLSHSVTGWFCGALFLAGTAIYIIGKRDKLMGLIVAITFAWLLLLLQLGLWYNSDLLLGVLGKDSTLTGRTEIWLATINLIKQRPLLGWGYMATWVPTDAPTTEIWDQLRWPVPNAHNAYLDVTLELGLVGLGLLLTIIVITWRRALACCTRGVLPLGWFSLMLIGGALLVGISETGLNHHQNIYWLLLNIFNFSCGLKLASLGKRSSFARNQELFGTGLAIKAQNGAHGCRQYGDRQIARADRFIKTKRPAFVSRSGEPLRNLEKKTGA